MEAEGKVKPKKRKRRKHAKPNLRYRGRLKRPDTSALLKAKWADPEWRAAMMERRKEQYIKAKGNTWRYGIPDGMRRAEAEPLNKAAEESAKKTMSELKQAGALGDLDARAEEALESAIGVMRKPGSKQVQLAAARLVLEYTKAKPASKSEVTVNKAEEWLLAVAERHDDDEGETS